MKGDGYITQDNLNDALLAVNLSNEIESEIRNAVLGGKIATAHGKPINFAGGGNGEFLDSELVDILGFFGFGIGLIGAAFGASLLVFISAIVAVVLIVS